MKRWIPLWKILSLAVLVWAPSGVMAAPSQLEIKAMFDEANAIYERGDETLAEDPKLARSLYAQSAALYRACIEQGGIDNADLHADLGNAEIRAGNVGLAIASYRRAERLDPTNPIARAGLKTARSQVTVLVNPDPPRFVIDAIFVWRKWIPRPVVFGVGVAAWLGLWVGIGLRTLGRGRVPTGLIVTCAAAALLTLGGQYAEQRMLYNGSNAVVIAPEIVGRNGPNTAAYQASFADPLVSGIEVAVLEERDGWRRVRLGDGRTTWLPADALETI